ncbi:beta-glucosidase 11 isoform X1 [Cucurbita pepo subsp. pepo]|uniref:beta-glucosidase 11 isoform X1 n=2 Tax=Cucurbita pepo subsp. pepo TaxID=3664 RepID=UPI000C9DA245|nr:beta-glucosidase 11 isoform X1 [Cucurbita pepo subsp. pepo]
MSNLGLINGLLLLMLLKPTGIGAAAAFANSYSRYDFPPAFVFGSGTTAYQVEGAAKQDGRTPSIWDTYAHSGDGPGGDGDIACDQYHKYKEDVKLMVDVGLDAYRFSISWSRLIPNGRGAINPKGLEYYNNLINELITHGIQPHVTLHNFDLPQALEDEYGGWVSPKIIEDFKAYAEVCFREFGDRVLHWSTINEANVFALGGYDLGFLPPQRCSPPFGIRNCSKGNSSTEPYLVVHHCLLAHASASSLYKNNYKDKQHGFVGISIYMFRFVPFTESKEDAKAVERAYEFLVNWVLHPLVFGEYPNLMKKNVGSKMPIFSDDASSLVKGSADFIGIIHYQNWHIKDDPYSFMMETRDLGADMGAKAIMLHENVTTPESLQMVIEYLKQVYGNPPTYVYENGLPMKRNSWLNDEPRVEYMHAYIGAVLDALRNGSNVKGYFSWSFLDVFELLDGYDSSYGLFYVDFDDPNLKRYSKFSAQWFSNFLKGKGKGKVAHSNGVLELKNNQTTLPSSSYSSYKLLE